MCATCGCSGTSFATMGGGTRYRRVDRTGDEVRRAEHASDEPRRVDINERVLAKNALYAQRNRAWLQSAGVVAFNLLSSPGSGKTTLLERTLCDLRSEHAFGVIEGDQETELDAERIRATGCPAVQINTGSGCHLEAEMVGHALQALGPAAGSVVMIENVGNLVCPALFDLGENAKVVMLSVTEGDDKPRKYPQMFRAATLIVVNKIDLLPHVRFDMVRFVEQVRSVSPAAPVLPLSALTGDGMALWYAWLRERAASAPTNEAAAVE